MSVWTSNYTIMRDLSKAQGRLVPVDMSSVVGVAVAANEKPPQLATEETEEEFYNKFTCGDFDYSATPDFGLIQQMLEIVRDGKESSDSSIAGDMIQISKVSALSEIKQNQNQTEKKGAKSKLTKAVIKPTEAKVKPPTEVAKVNPPAGDGSVKKKRQRNVAVTSLLAVLESKENNNNNEPIKLLKPTDFISTKAVTESVRKVDEWFTNKENSTQKSFPSLSSATMFKKKSLSEKSEKQPEKESVTQISPCKSTGIFKPSLKADEYYQKYLEKSQLKNSIKEDIWQKAERLMKEADAKRAAKAAQVLEEVESVTEQELLQTLDDTDEVPTEHESTNYIISLTEPRHTGTEDDNCIVCTTMRKHGYDLNHVTPIEHYNTNEVLTPISSYADCELD